MMNSVILNANVVGNPKISQTQNGATKAVFTVQTDGRDLPLYFQIVAFGNPAETASKLIEGDEILLSGRMVASAFNKTMAIVANSVEFIFDEEQGNEAAGGK